MEYRCREAASQIGPQGCGLDNVVDRFMPTTFQIRRATPSDAAIVARHRAEMFLEMNLLPGALYGQAMAVSIAYFERSLATEEYLGWFASPTSAPEKIAGGVGLIRRRVPPHPRLAPEGVVLQDGRQGLVLNVFTEPEWRRRGLAELLMRHLMSWAKGNDVETLVLHASAAGQRIYERLGFVTRNEMRLSL
jgi:GNAT superfamily N-acetyltransferase